MPGVLTFLVFFVDSIDEFPITVEFITVTNRRRSQLQPDWFDYFPVAWYWPPKKSELLAISSGVKKPPAYIISCSKSIATLFRPHLY
jgi:hypothetical protein